MATEAAVPALLMTAEAVTLSVSTGADGVQEELVGVRSGFGAGVPKTWNSAACPPGAPLLLVMDSSTSATRALTGMVTVFWLLFGSKE